MTEYIGSRKVVGVGHGGIELAENVLTDEEVIRCRDCKHHESLTYKTLEMREVSRHFCLNFFTIDGGPFSVRPDGFCAWAERGE